jgi:uncharacterized protein
MLLKRSFVVIAVVGLMMGCSKNNNKKEDNFDHSAMLANMADNLIVPAYEQLAAESGLLLDAATTFSATTNITALENLQLQFKNTYKAWLHCEPFNFGPADNTVMLQNAINYWPARTSFVDAELAGSNELTDNYINSLGAEKKGFPALSYILFDINNGNNAVLDKFSSARRKEYLVALAKNIKINVAAVLNEWKSGYTTTFKNNTGTELNTSLSLLLNNLVIELETSKNKRIGIPVGRKDNFTQGAADPGAVELPTSSFAKEMLKESSIVLSNIFEGKYGSTDGIGFDDYLAALKIEDNGVGLEQSISTEFSAFTTTIEQIGSPMQTTVTNNPAAVDAAWVQSKKLLVLLKVDLASNLGILITFSDNDGD